MTQKLNESAVEEQTLAWFSELGYQTLYGPDISPDPNGTPGTDRDRYEQVILTCVRHIEIQHDTTGYTEAIT